MTHFVERDIGLVVRLNSELYCPSYFTALGIQHIDMIFEDGTCPPLPLVRKFIKLAHDMIVKKKGIAVHCKAGLGRTGCLIGAYLIYRHGFLGVIDGNDVQNGQYQDENLPAPTPGQPRKYARLDTRSHPYARSTSGTFHGTQPDTEIVTMKSHRQGATGSGADSEEEYMLQRLAAKRSVSRSPQNKGKGRSVSYTTTTTTTTKRFDEVGDTMGIYQDPDCAEFEWSDLEQVDLNRSQSGRPKTPHTMKSGSGNGMSVSKTRASPRRSGGEEKQVMKVRKTSGRVGSAGHAPITAKR